MQDLFAQIAAKAEALSGTLTACRRDLHRYPEPGWLEMRTSSLVARRLSELGWQVIMGPQVCGEQRLGLPDEDILERHYSWAAQHGADRDFLPAFRGGYTGVTAILDGGDGPTLALRFDMDALSLGESLDPGHRPAREGFASACPGAMHACGHDGHVSIGLGVAQVLSELRERLHGRVKLLFQPAEEGVRGARCLAEQGQVDDADYVLAAHILDRADCPEQVAVIKRGGCGLATTKFDVEFMGRASHAGRTPQLGANAMLAAATAVLNMQAIPRYGSEPTFINVGRLSAGSGRNVVCDRALLEAETRGHSGAANDYIYDYACRAAKAAADMHGCGCRIILQGAAPDSENSPQLNQRLALICRQGLGVTAAEWDSLPGGSEDFAWLARRVQDRGGQAAYFGLLADCAAPSHSPAFDFDESILPVGVKVFCAMAVDILGR